MMKLKVIVALMVFSGFLFVGTGLIAQQRPGGGIDPTKGIVPLAPTVKSLIQARIEVAKEIFETTVQRHQQFLKAGDLEDVVAWSRHWMEDQIHLDPDPSRNVAAIQDHLDRTRRIEAIMDNYAKTGQGQAVDTLKVKYFRLEAEQMLTELRIVNPEIFPAKPATKP